MMELEPQQSSPTDSGLFLSRKERGAIAAQACETCRNRKQKCSEGRPKCSSCVKLQTPCVYRSPPVTKKDRTLLHILERLKSVENKIDGLAAKDHANIAFTSPGTVLSDAEPTSIPSASAPSPVQSRFGNSYRYASSVSQMIAWPEVRQHLESLEAIPPLDRQGLRQNAQQQSKSLPFDRIQAISFSPQTAINVPLPLTELEYNTATFNWNTIHRLSKAFFDTFNLMHPILDQDAFNSTIHNVISCGFGDDTHAILMFLVLALGEVALAISSGFPVLLEKNHVSGLDGFTMDRPPGLVYLNEARKRMGFVMAEVSLENVQMFSLAAMYYDRCGRYSESRRLAANASLACYSLITRLDELNHGPADILRRNYWHCCITELSWYMECDVPTSGLERFSDAVGPPVMSPAVAGEHFATNLVNSFQEQFTSEIALHQLSTSFHTTLTSAFASGYSNTFPSSPPPTDAPYSLLKQFATQLEQWRAVLPEFLQWQDDQPSTLSDPNTLVMLTLGMGNQAAGYSHAGDIQVALFRTRYYYNKYILHRPFVFKALHFQSITNEDAQGVAACLKASLRWPIVMSPPCLNKRLIPLSVFWSRNIFGILVLLHLSRHHPVLSRIRSRFCGQHFEFEADETIGLYIDWLRDMMKTDPGVEKCWPVVKEMFSLQA